MSGGRRQRRQRRRLLRRLVIFAAILLVLSLSGLGLLLFRWWGERGAPPAGRLYVQGDFERAGRLAVLERQASDRACYEVEVDGVSTDAEAEAVTVCRGKKLRVWVEDALLDVSVGARGVPRVSIAGVRARPGEVLGSLADSGRRGHPRFPLRAQGVPGVAGRVVACPSESSAGAELCLEVLDRLGRLARVHGDGRVEVPTPGDVVRLAGGDVLWLGLVGFEVRYPQPDPSQEGELATLQSPAVILDRVDRLRPRRRGGDEGKASDLGGDRRWLGRLWHVEAPDPSAESPDRFEIFPMRERYTPHNLSRQRTNLEGEDVMQRLIDGGWLCLEKAAGEGSVPGPRLAWRSLDEPGCGDDRRSGGFSRSNVEDYRRARFGDLSYLAGSLVSTANVALATNRHLEDATQLPFVFDWRLQAPEDASSKMTARRLPQPVPRRLWGVRFGITRQIRRVADLGRGLPPAVLPRASTARHVLQVLRDDELLVSHYLPLADATADAAATGRRGSVCLGRHSKTDAAGNEVVTIPLQPTSGNHYPLGSVAFRDDPQTGTWTPDPDAACSGCRLSLTVEDAGLAVVADGDCDQLEMPSGNGESTSVLAHGEELTRGDLRLRHVERGDGPWLAASDPGTGRRHFAEEFYLRGRLRPLLGDAAALSGVEAALRELLQDAGDVGVAPGLESVELTVDGDLQLAAASIVDALARPQIAKDDPEPHRVSVTAAILDARGGDLLAVVNWSSQDSEEGRRGAWSRPTAWELGSGQAEVLENAALLRRGAIGSTMKITGSYALINNDGLTPGPEIERRGFREAPIDRGRLYLSRGVKREPPSRRRCSTGPHLLPRNDAEFTTGTFIRRFASSCNNFFVMTGFRHASSQPADLRQPSIWPEDGAGPQELLLDLRQRDKPILVGPSPAVQTLAERIRDGLAADFATGARPPESLYGILVQLGFQPRSELFTAQGEAPAELGFEHRARPVVVSLVNDWFAPGGGNMTPALKPGRDFSYPGVPSPGRLDEATVRGPSVAERYDSQWREVRRFAEGRADVQWAMLMIGQSSVESSAVGLASLYAPAAREDGRAVSPCLFRANCGPHRAGSRVVDPAGAGAEILNQALSAVTRDGTARGGLVRVGRRHLVDSGWGGKTGTYQVERGRFVGLTSEQWRHLRTWACGVEGVARPRIAAGSSRVAALAGELSRAPAGSALGARVCEGTDLPLNPAGVHAYRGGELPARLDELARELKMSAETDTLIYHSFVTLVPSPRGLPADVDNPAKGIIVAVLVDRQTADKSVAIKIGGELAAAVERWASSSR